MEKDLIEKIVNASQANPGATMALTKMLHYGQYHQINKIIEYGIRGSDIYVMFNDLCDRDPVKVAILLDKCPMDILKDACSREDRSGKKMIEQYLS